MQEVEKFQICPHLWCGDIGNFSICGETSDFSISVTFRNLKYLHMANFSTDIMVVLVTNMRYVVHGHWQFLVLPSFLATLVALHFTPVSESLSQWAEFRTSVAPRLASLLSSFCHFAANALILPCFAWVWQVLNQKKIWWWDEQTCQDMHCFQKQH